MLAMGRRLALLALGLGAALGIYFAFTGAPEEVPEAIIEKKIARDYVPPTPITDTERVQRELAAALALAPGHGFPGSLPLHSLHEVAVRGGITLENLIQTNPVAFLHLCLEQYEQEVRGYTLTFVKKERINGKLHPPERDKYEIIEVACREKPFSVFFNWKAKGKLAARVLYVEGENDGKMLARPFITALPIMKEDVNSPKAKNAGRYTIAESGFYKATQRTVYHMEQAQARGTLHVRYEGQVTLHEVGDRPCYKFVRTPYDPPEEEGVNELTLYIDCENWLQVASILRDPQGNLLAEYFFRDIRLNPEFSEKQFARESL
jgi:hypothetical protein